MHGRRLHTSAAMYASGKEVWQLNTCMVDLLEASTASACSWASLSCCSRLLRSFLLAGRCWGAAAGVADTPGHASSHQEDAWQQPLAGMPCSAGKKHHEDVGLGWGEAQVHIMHHT